MTEIFSNFISQDIERFFHEDGIDKNLTYLTKIPKENVYCQLKIKDDLTLSGLPYFYQAFKYLGAAGLSYEVFNKFEGQEFKKRDQFQIEFELPFNIALLGERVALNLLQRSSSISTFTKSFVRIANEKGITILDTRKTLPGFRSLEKYAVVIGGGKNHRFDQTDMFMVKDNHKSFFGGIKNSLDFFKGLSSFYTEIEVEVHSLEELEEAISLGIRHIMLDNFSPNDIEKACDLKSEQMTYEVSGGVRLSNLCEYLIDGIDAISVGALTYGAPPVDLSLKYQRG